MTGKHRKPSKFRTSIRKVCYPKFTLAGITYEVDVPFAVFYFGLAICVLIIH